MRPRVVLRKSFTHIVFNFCWQPVAPHLITKFDATVQLDEEPSFWPSDGGIQQAMPGKHLVLLHKSRGESQPSYKLAVISNQQPFSYVADQNIS